MNKRTENIFLSLVKKYIAFVLLVIMSIFLTFIFIISQVTASAEKGNVPKLGPSAIVRGDYKNIYTKDIENVQGWVEILDANMNVIYTKGNKRDDFYKYSEQDMINILNMDNNSKYVGMLRQFKSQDQKDLYCLVKYPATAFNLQINLKESSYETGSIIYDNIIKGGIFFLLLSIANIVLFSIWTSKKINKPLIEITKGIAKMIDGNYDTKLEFKAEKEFAEIRDSFNYMAEKLKTTEEEKEKIQQSKTRMLVDLSHDIKTPISTIQCFSKALDEGLIECEDKKQRYYHTIYNKCGQVSELINDLFEFVKLESTDYEPIMIKSDFCEFIREIITEFYNEMEEKKYELDIRIPEKEIIIGFDKKIMNRAISNLLCNAIKYNPEGTQLRIEIKETLSAVVLEIGDNGLGIPNHIKDIIFDPFVRGDETRKSDGGTGLGLAISKKIVEKHNGKLELYTNNNDEMTTFAIILDKHR
jgi:signal transduction histidine kinase